VSKQKEEMTVEKTTLHVQGMSCGHCKAAIESAVKEVGAEARVNLEAGTVDVIYDPSAVNLQTVKAAIEDAGYDVV
jgi:copper chaperone